MLISFTGRARNGKTTAAEAIAARADELHLVPVIYDIGAFVLEHCHAEGLIPAELTREQLSAAQLEILVRVGKEKRAENPRFWIERIETDYKRLCGLEREPGPKFVALIPNLRYQNEAKMVRNLGGVVVKVSALNKDGSPYISKDRDPNDPSETQLLHLSSDYTITAQVGHSDLIAGIARLIFERELAK